jgi:hypothetical protein
VPREGEDHSREPPAVPHPRADPGHPGEPHANSTVLSRFLQLRPPLTRGASTHLTTRTPDAGGCDPRHHRPYAERGLRTSGQLGRGPASRSAPHPTCTAISGVGQTRPVPARARLGSAQGEPHRPRRVQELPHLSPGFLGITRLAGVVQPMIAERKQVIGCLISAKGRSSGSWRCQIVSSGTRPSAASISVESTGLRGGCQITSYASHRDTMGYPK